MTEAIGHRNFAAEAACELLAVGVDVSWVRAGHSVVGRVVEKLVDRVDVQAVIDGVTTVCRCYANSVRRIGAVECAPESRQLPKLTGEQFALF